MIFSVYFVNFYYISKFKHSPHTAIYRQSQSNGNPDCSNLIGQATLHGCINALIGSFVKSNSVVFHCRCFNRPLIDFYMTICRQHICLDVNSPQPVGLLQ